MIIVGVVFGWGDFGCGEVYCLEFGELGLVSVVGGEYYVDGLYLLLDVCCV